MTNNKKKILKTIIYIISYIIIYSFNCSIVLMFAQNVSTNQHNQKPVEKIEKIEKITVIAHQKYLTPENTSAHISIIHAEEIRASGARNIGEVLDSVAGTYVQNYGSLGSLSVISIRGSSSQQVLVLINGKRLNTAQGGGVDFSTINPESIERIEIIRGGASAIYGENALGGVINIITKSGEKKSTREAYYSYGSYQTHIAGASIQGFFNGKSIDYFFSFRGITSEGNYLFTDQKRKTEKQRINTGLLAGDGEAKIGWDFGRGKKHRVSFNFQYHQDDKGVPGMVDFPTVSASMKEKRIISMLGYDYKKLPFLSKGMLNVGLYSIFQKRNFKDTEFFLGKINDWHDNRAYGIDTTFSGNIHGWIFQKLSFGYSYRWDWLTSTGLEKSPGILEKGEVYREAHSIFIKDELHLFQYSKKRQKQLFGRIVFIPAFRYDMNSLYDNVLSKQIGVMLNPDRKQRIILKGNAGTAYRAPSFNDLFWPATAFAIGNPDLKPEKSINWDTGLLCKLYSWLSTELVYYNSEVIDLIQWNPGPGGRWIPRNMDKVLLQGIETEIKAIWTLNFISSYMEMLYNYSLMYATDKTESPSTKEKQLPRRPYEKANFIISLQAPQVYFIRWETKFVGFRYITAHNTKYMDSYYTHNINTGIYIWKHYELSLLIKNIFNNEYIDIREYPIPGREIIIKIGVQF